MRNRLLSAAVAAVLALAPVSRGDDAPPPSGLKPGSDLPGPFHPLNLTGKRSVDANGKPAEKYHCLVCERGLDPSVIVFAAAPDEGASSPVFTLLQKLEELIDRPKLRNSRLGAFAVFLTNKGDDEVERPKLIQRLRDGAQGKIKTEPKDVRIPLTLAAEENSKEGPFRAATVDGPKKYNANTGFVTVIVYHKERVVKNFAFERALTDEDVAAVVKAVEELVTPKK
jgi:hypothetical protein